MTQAEQKYRHEWYQTDEYTIISFFIKGLRQDQVQIDFKPKTLNLLVKLEQTNSTYEWDLDPLAHEIVPNECSFEVLKTKIEIKLKKAVIGRKWGTLEGQDVDLPMASVVSSAQPVYPSSAKNKKNWSEIEKSIDEDKPEGEQALNALFQQIYRDGSEETKKAMMKSFVESGGTTLSTNWEDVKKKKVTVKPPDGMEARTWEQ